MQKVFALALLLVMVITLGGCSEGGSIDIVRNTKVPLQVVRSFFGKVEESPSRLLDSSEFTVIVFNGSDYECAMTGEASLKPGEIVSVSEFVVYRFSPKHNYHMLVASRATFSSPPAEKPAKK